MLIEVHPKNPDDRKIKQIIACLQKGGVIIYPTDTVYGIGCSIEHPEAIERICQIKNINPLKVQLSFLCNDLSHISEYAKSIDTPLFRLMKNLIPGPYTFILPASKKVPKLLKTKKETIGLRVPNNAIARVILKELGHPILSASLPVASDEEIYADPYMIHERFGSAVDYIVDGGEGGKIPSTILDCTEFPPVMIRSGLGPYIE